MRDDVTEREVQPTPAAPTSPVVYVPDVPAMEFASSLVAPGSATLPRRPVTGVALLAIGVGAPIALVVWVVLRRGDAVRLALDSRVLGIAVVVLVLAVLARAAALAEVTVARKRAEGNVGAAPFVAASVLVLTAVPVTWAAQRLVEARRVVDAVFAEGSADPLFESPTAPAAPGSVTTTNVLLLAGAPEAGRWGLRTDTVVVASTDRSSGRTVLLSLPGDVSGIRFPESTPLAEQFPNGFDDALSALAPLVTSDQELSESYAGGGLEPGAVAVTGAVGATLGLRIDDYVLVDVAGVSDVVDALGGVTVELDEAATLPTGDDMTGSGVPSVLGPGPVVIDGPTALALVAASSTVVDADRLDRQRDVLDAIGTELSPAEAFRSFSSVADALGDSVRTSLGSDEFADLVDVLTDGEVIESVVLAPPLVDLASPDWSEIREVVESVQRALATGVPSGFGET